MESLKPEPFDWGFTGISLYRGNLFTLVENSFREVCRETALAQADADWRRASDRRSNFPRVCFGES